MLLKWLCTVMRRAHGTAGLLLSACMTVKDTLQAWPDCGAGGALQGSTQAGCATSSQLIWSAFCQGSPYSASSLAQIAVQPCLKAPEPGLIAKRSKGRLHTSQWAHMKASPARMLATAPTSTAICRQGQQQSLKLERRGGSSI